MLIVNCLFIVNINVNIYKADPVFQGYDIAQKRLISLHSYYSIVLLYILLLCILLYLNFIYLLINYYKRVKLGSGEACYRKAVEAMKAWKTFDVPGILFIYLIINIKINIFIFLFFSLLFIYLFVYFFIYFNFNINLNINFNF